LVAEKAHPTAFMDARTSSSPVRVPQGNGTNPEQLFAAGWSACFLCATQVVASRQKITLPADAAVDAEVDLSAQWAMLMKLLPASVSACPA
jgi:organic hydroperoxide reductase OsmC/OhrA